MRLIMTAKKENFNIEVTNKTSHINRYGDWMNMGLFILVV